MSEFTICWIVRNVGVGPLLAYSGQRNEIKNHNEIAVYLDAASSVKVSITNSYVVFFDIKAVAGERNHNRFCLR